MLPIERLLLLLDLLRIPLVLALHLADQRLHPLHLLLLPDLRGKQGSQDRADDNREDDDRQSEVAEQEPICEHQQVEEGQVDDVPRRGEVLDPEEAGGDEWGQGGLISWDRVVAARMERVAACDTECPQP